MTYIYTPVIFFYYLPSIMHKGHCEIKKYIEILKKKYSGCRLMTHVFHFEKKG